MKLVGSKEAIRSPEFHKKRVFMRWVKAVTAFLIVLVVVVGPLILLRNKHVRITAVNIEGNEVVKNEDIESIVASDLSGYYWKVIPKDSAPFYPKAKIQADISSALPRLKSVQVSLANSHSLKVLVSEREPHALYCDENVASKCYFLDDTGYIFAEAPGFSPEVYMTYTTDPALESPIRTELFKQDELKATEKFLNGMKSLGIEPLLLKRTGDEYELTQKSGPVVRWKSTQDLDTIFVNLESFINNSGLKVADIQAMQYIDLRFDNKVFYK